MLVRLSSEGECIFDNQALTAISNGSNSYEYFTYTCYVGPGWYGNVGVTVVNDNGSGPNICVGDPGFNNGVSNSTQTSAHPKESGVRTYRGFRPAGGSYLSTGMAGERKYGYSLVDGGGPAPGAPFDGRHRPSDYPLFYNSTTAGSSSDYLNHDFLLTKSSPSTSCASKMAGVSAFAGSFFRNASSMSASLRMPIPARPTNAPPSGPASRARSAAAGRSISPSIFSVPASAMAR